jgi:basic membrane lipoprotein Med (substrate-binding protein (PBP1-ABC) superfamily)
MSSLKEQEEACLLAVVRAAVLKTGRADGAGAVDPEETTSSSQGFVNFVGNLLLLFIAGASKPFVCK